MTTTTVRTVNLNCPDWCVRHDINIDECDPRGGTVVHRGGEAVIEIGAAGPELERLTLRAQVRVATRLDNGEEIADYSSAATPLYVQLSEDEGYDYTLSPTEARALADALVTMVEQIEARA